MVVDYPKLMHDRSNGKKDAASDQCDRHETRRERRVDSVVAGKIFGAGRHLLKDKLNFNKATLSYGLQRKPKSLHPKSGAKACGQHGQPRVMLLQSPMVSHHVILPLPLIYDICGAQLAKETRQVIELPEICSKVTERGTRTQCTCGVLNCSAFPDVMPAAQYDPIVKAATTYLTQYRQLSVKGCPTRCVNLSAYSSSVRRITIFCAPLKNLRQKWQKLPEPSLPQQWRTLHGKLAMTNMNILPRYQGKGVHDRWATYCEYSSLHVLCRRPGVHQGQRRSILQSPATKLLRRMIVHVDAVLRFTTETGVPYANSLGKRDVHIPKLIQKVSGRCSSIDGVAALRTMRSYLSTLHERVNTVVMTFTGNTPSACVAAG